MVSKLTDKEFNEMLAEAKKDPQFHKEIKEFIKITTGIYNLKDYDLESS